MEKTKRKTAEEIHIIIIIARPIILLFFFVPVLCPVEGDDSCRGEVLDRDNNSIE